IRYGHVTGVQTCALPISVEVALPFAAAAPPELSEPPSYFNREVRQAFQMRVGELGSYIDGLHRAGFDVATLMVQWHKKIAYPLMAPVSILLAIPFAFLVGTRGAIGGVALGVAIGVAYLAMAGVLEAMGDRKSTRLNSSHVAISYAVFCLKKKSAHYRHL